MKLKLSNYFKAIGAKRLSEVEVTPNKSNQHELNGVSQFKEIFGSGKVNFTGQFMYLSDKETEEEFDVEITKEDGNATWYDAREKHPTRSEFRLYYTSNEAINLAQEGDLLIIGLKENNELIIIISEKGSTSEEQLKWLFSLHEIDNKFITRNIVEHDSELQLPAKRILEAIGFEVDETDESLLEEMLQKFNNQFPETKTFSDYARAKVIDIDLESDPDNALVSWYEKEKILFKTLEKYFVSAQLQNGFGKDGKDVDAFIEYSLSVHNRRKSRAGKAFENHLEVIFQNHNIHYSRGKATEKKNKPDFIFPDIKFYHQISFDTNLLTMLGVKTTAKDRWRQILSEANRITNKHLITLEPAISTNQTDEMKEKKVQLVIPQSIISTFSTKQQQEIISFKDFIRLVKERQRS